MNLDAGEGHKHRHGAAKRAVCDRHIEVGWAARSRGRATTRDGGQAHGNSGAVVRKRIRAYLTRITVRRNEFGSSDRLSGVGVKSRGFFGSVGFGLYGRISPAATVGVSLLMYGFMIVLSQWWMGAVSVWTGGMALEDAHVRPIPADGCLTHLHVTFRVN